MLQLEKCVCLISIAKTKGKWSDFLYIILFSLEIYFFHVCCTSTSPCLYTASNNLFVYFLIWHVRQKTTIEDSTVNRDSEQSSVFCLLCWDIKVSLYQIHLVNGYRSLLNVMPRISRISCLFSVVQKLSLEVEFSGIQ